jgi:two-component system, cell cycle sensor histidine kinase and response regulator CckA
MMAAVFGNRSEVGRASEFELDFADQGQAGLALLERAVADGRPYAMAFVDVRMPPGWDGIETIGHLWKCDPTLQIVICTAYSDYSWQEIISKVGNSDQLLILKKPFDNIEVLQLAHAMTRKWTVTRQAAARLDDLDCIVAARTAELQAANNNLAAEVAERAAVQDALRRSEERFAKAFNSNPLPIAIIQHDGLVCADVNAAFLEGIGAPRESVIGRRLLDVALVGDAALRGELESGTAIASRECRLRTSGGALKPARIWTEPVDIEGVPHSLAIIEDISAQQLVETRMRQAQKMESVGHLAAGVAHDFNNLITVIRGHASLRLESKALDPAIAASFHAVNEAAGRAATLTQQLLAYSRKQVMQPKVIRLGGVLSDVTGMIRRLVPENIAIDYRLPDEFPPVYADASNIEQVIMNLIVNARDAMPSGGRLTIAAECVTRVEERAGDHPEARPGSFLRLTVEDTGNGITESIRGKIFEPFFSTSPRPTASSSSTTAGSRWTGSRDLEPSFMSSSQSPISRSRPNSPSQARARVTHPLQTGRPATSSSSKTIPSFATSRAPCSPRAAITSWKRKTDPRASRCPALSMVRFTSCSPTWSCPAVSPERTSPNDWRRNAQR